VASKAKIKEKTRRAYEKVGTEYDSWYWSKSSRELREGLRKKVIRTIKGSMPAKKPSILDVGCGTGYLVSDLRELGSYTGVDFASEMINVCKTRFPKERFKLGDADDLPFKENSFDLIVCFWTFHHFTNPERVMSEFRRVLKPGGKIIIATFRKASWNPLVWLADAVSSGWYGFRTYRYDKSDFEALMKPFNNLKLEIFPPMDLRSFWSRIGIAFIIATGEK